MLSNEDIIKEIQSTNVCDVKQLKKHQLTDDYARGVSGVYFLFHGDTLQYVGESSKIYMRIGDHKGAKNIPFDRYAIIECEIQQLRIIIEKINIWQYNPPYNKEFKREKPYAWLKKPYHGNHRHVKINKGTYRDMTKKEYEKWLREQDEKAI